MKKTKGNKNLWELQRNGKEGMGKKSSYAVVITGIILAMLFLILPSSKADAAAKLGDKKMEIGINQTKNVYVYSVPTGGKITYTSDNKKVATVSKKGVVKGIQYGSAKITVKCTQKKKTTKVGTMKVTVKKSEINDYYKTGMQVSNQPGVFNSIESYFTGSEEPIYGINYYNPKAVYKYYSSNKKKLSITTAGKIKDVSGTGKVTVTVKETYKKKTRTVGTMEIEIKSPTYVGEEEITLVKGESIYLEYDLQLCAMYYCYYSDEKEDIKDINPVAEELKKTEQEDDTVLEMVKESNGEWYGVLKAIGEGTRYVYLYMYDYNQKKYTDLIASFVVHVIEIKEASEVRMDFDVDPEYYDEDEYNEEDGYQIYSYRTKRMRVYQTPYNYTGDYTITSSDPNVVSVCDFSKTGYYDSDEGYAGSFYISTKASGTATITVAANGAKREFKVTVRPVTVYTDSSEYISYVCSVSDFGGNFDRSLLAFESSDSSIAEMSLYDDYDDDEKDIYFLDFKAITKEKDGNVTLKALYNGVEIYSITLDVIED